MTLYLPYIKPLITSGRSAAPAFTGLFAFSTYTFRYCDFNKFDGPNMNVTNTPSGNECSYVTAWANESWYSNYFVKSSPYHGGHVFTIPRTGTYTFQLKGGDGGKGTSTSISHHGSPGQAATVQLDYALTQGDKIGFVIATMGQDGPNGGGGGGGTFLWKEAANPATDFIGAGAEDNQSFSTSAEIIAVAGGGGGSGSGTLGSYTHGGVTSQPRAHGSGGSATTDANTIAINTIINGAHNPGSMGTNGIGNGGAVDTTGNSGTGGRGVFAHGDDSSFQLANNYGFTTTYTRHGGGRQHQFINIIEEFMWYGGFSDQYESWVGKGGYGGGGSAGNSNFQTPGGGGGYTGGGSGKRYRNHGNNMYGNGGAAGGGSYANPNATNVTITAGTSGFTGTRTSGYLEISI